MSVRSETYLLWGWLLDYDVYGDKTNEEQDAIHDLSGTHKPVPGEIARLVDGMGGSYVAVGMVVDRATDDGDFFEPVNISDLSPPEGARSLIWEAVSQFTDTPGDPSFILLTHHH